MWLLIHAGIRWQDVSQYLVSDFNNQYGPKIIDLLTELRRQPNCFTVLTCATWQLRLCCVVARCELLKQSSNLTVILGPLNLCSAVCMIIPFLIQIALSAGQINIEKLWPMVKWLVPDVRTPATANPYIRITNKKVLTKQYIGNIFNVNVQVKNKHSKPKCNMLIRTFSEVKLCPRRA